MGIYRTASHLGAQTQYRSMLCTINAQTALAFKLETVGGILRTPCTPYGCPGVASPATQKA